MNEKAQKIIQYLNEGKTYKQIEHEMGASPATIAKVKRNNADQIVLKDKSYPGLFEQVKTNTVIPEQNIPQIIPISNINTIRECGNPDIIAELKKVKAEKGLLVKEKVNREREFNTVLFREKKKDDFIKALKSRIKETTKNVHQQRKLSHKEKTGLQKQVDQYKFELSSIRKQYEKIRLERNALLNENNDYQNENEHLRKQLKLSGDEIENLKLQHIKFRAKDLKKKLIAYKKNS